MHFKSTIDCRSYGKIISMLNLVLIMISTAGAFTCFGDVGTFIITVKVYVDEDSAKEIGKYAKRLRNHSDYFKSNNDENGGLSNVKFFFGLIFDEINASIINSNIQLEADFSEMLEPKYQNLKEKYCVHFSNIINITESFLSEELLPEKMGENKLLVIDCAGNTPYLPQRNHIASKNGCGHVAGVLLGDVYKLHETVKETLYNTFGKEAHANVIEADRRLIASNCTLINECYRRFHDFGYFVKGLRTIGKPSDLQAIQHYGSALWNFNHSYALEPASISDNN